MKTRLLTFVAAGFLVLFAGSLYSQKGMVNNGAKITVSSGAVIKISGTEGHYTNKTSGSTHGRIDLDGKMKLAGNWNNNATSGSVFINVDTDGEVVFEGTTAQTISGNSTGFEMVTLDNASGVSLATNTNVNGMFTFTNGRMTLGSYNLTLGTASTIGGTPSATKMFVATGTGELRKSYSAVGSFLFPVGDNTATYEYSPITLNFTSGSFGGSAYAGIRVTDAKHPNNNASTDYISRYWKVSQNNISGFSCSLTGVYLTADIVGVEANMFTGRWISPNWLKLDAVNTGLNQISGIVTTLGDFSAGGQSMFCSPAITLSENVTDVTCYGGNDGEIDLIVTNGLAPYTYNWSTVGGSGLVNGIEDQTGLTAATYNVTVTDYNGCTATDVISVTYINNPVANAGADDDLCPGQSTVQLSASGGTSYQWSPTTGLSNPNIFNPVANPASSTTYTVTVTDGAGCTDTDNVLVTVNTIPTANAGTDAAICAGQSTTLTATGGGTYNWNNGLGAGASHVVSPASTTIYTVTVTNAAGCTDTDNVTVNVNALPVANAGADDDLCPGQSTVQLTATGGTSYVWSPTTGLSNPNISNPIANPASTTTYTVTVTNAAGCTATDAVLVTVNSIPVANAGADDDLCPGQSTVQLSASGGTSYAWSPSTGLSNPNIFNPVANPASTTTYTVTVTNAGGCTASDAVLVTVNTIPTASAGIDKTICAGQTTSLTATGGGTYLWSNSSTTATINVSPAVTTVYTVTVTNAAGCTDSDAATVTVNPNPVADAGVDQNIPNGTSTSLDGSASGGTGPYSFIWSPGAQLVVPNIEDPTTVILSSSVTFTVTVTDDATGCTSTDNVLITVTGGPLSASASATPSTICLGGSSQLNGVANGGSGTYTYTWTSVPPGFNSTSQNPVVNPTVTTQYDLDVFDTFTHAYSSATVTVNPLPTADAGADDAICAGSSTTLTATGGSSYEWNTGEFTASIIVGPSSTTNYWVTVTDGNGCTDTDDVLVTVNALPVVDAGTDQSIPYGTSTALDATVSGGSGNFTYAWSPGGLLVDPAVVDPTTTNLTSTTVFTLLVTDNITTCQNSDNTTVNITGTPLAAAPSAVPSALCSGSLVQLNANASGGSGSYTYTWASSPAGFSSSSATPTDNPVTTTTYYVTVDDGYNTASNSVVVTVYALPTANAGTDDAICNGESTTITATGGTSYVWDNGLGTGASHAVNPTSTTTYTVTVTDGNGCTDTDDVLITVNPLPNANAGANTAVCNGSSTTITAVASTGTPTLTYAWDNGLGAGVSHLVTPASTTTYIVTVTDGNGCTDIDDIIVTVNPLPNANAGSDKVICEGGSATITATGGTSYNWDNGLGSGATHVVSPASTTVYTVTVTGVNGCTDTDDVMVTVNTLPLADAGSDETVCEGESVTLTATGGVSYNWDNGIDQGVPFVPTATTTYTVTVTDLNGCTNTDAAVVTVNPLPVADAGINQDICYGTSASLTATGGGTYYWSTTETTASISVSPSATETFFVTVTNTFGCTDEDDVTVNVNPLPIPDAGVDQSVCQGESATLIASGGTSYVWSGGVTQGVPFVPAITATYTVTVSDANGCTDTDNLVVTVLINPTANAGIDQTVCQGSNVTLIATGGASYSWNGGVVQGNPFIPTGSNTYTVTVTAANGCTDSDDVYVLVNPSPPANAGTDQSICIGASANLTATGGDTYYWSTTETTASIIVTPASTTTYTVTVTDANLCTASDNVTVTVNPLPVANAGTDVTICDGSSVTLTASGGTNYAWSGGITQGVAFIPTASEVFTVTVTTAAGCTATDDVAVTVNALPVADAGADVAVCDGGSVTLTATGGTSYSWSGGISQGVPFTPGASATYSVTATDGNGCTATDDVDVTVNDNPLVDAGLDLSIPYGTTTLIDATVSGGTGSYTYSWAPADSLVDPLIEDPTTVNLYTTNIFTIVVTDASTGCQGTDNVTVVVTGGPLVAYSYADPDTICEGDMIQLFAIPGGGSGTYTFTWTSTPAGFNSTDQDPNDFPVVSTTYHLHLDDGSNTYDKDVEVVVNPLPVADAGVDQTVCENEQVTLSATGGVSYNWNNGVTQDVPFTPAFSNNYSVTVTDANACSATDDVNVNVNTSPIADAGMNQAVCEGEQVTLSATGGDSYAWDNGVTQDVAFVPVATTTYVVTVSDANGCTDTDSVIVTVNTIPVADAGTDVTVCAGTSVTLTATGGDTYNWSGTVTQGTPFTPSVTNTYYVTVTSAEGCTAVDSVVVTVNPLPVADAGTDLAICMGESVTLSATGGDSYVWDNSVQQDVAFTPATTTVYSVTVTDVNGCTDSDYLTVTVNDLPTVDAGLDLSIPYMTSTVIDAAVGGGSGSYLYNWSPADSLLNATIEDPTTVDMHATTIFVLVVTDGVTGCENSDTITIVVTGGPLLANPYADTDTICEGDFTQLHTLASGGSGSYTYTWSSNPAGFTSTDENPVVSPLVTTVYTVTVNDGTDDYPASVTVNVLPLPLVELGNDTNICDVDTIILDAGAGYDNYYWSTGATTQTISVDSAGYGLTTVLFSVTVTDNGCEATDFIYVTFDVCGEITPVDVRPMSVSIFPNPTDGKMFVTFKDFSDPVTIAIMDMNGKLVYNELLTNQPGNFVREIDLTPYAIGTYTVKFFNDKFQKIERVVVY